MVKITDFSEEFDASFIMIEMILKEAAGSEILIIFTILMQCYTHTTLR
jgi:hypothetical protein